MTEQKTNRTEEQLEQELRKSKGGKLSGKILSMLGVVIAVAGIILGGNLVLVVIGGVILGLGQMVQGKSKEQSDRQAFDAIAPDIVGTVFENVQMNPRSSPPGRKRHQHSPAQPHLLQRQWVYPRNISRPEYGAVYRPSDGSQ